MLILSDRFIEQVPDVVLPFIIALHILVEVSAVEQLSVVTLLLFLHVHVRFGLRLDFSLLLGYLDRVVVVRREVTLLPVQIAK